MKNKQFVQRIRLLMALFFLIISIALLAWGFWPVVLENQVLQIKSIESTMPTPASFVPNINTSS